MNDDLRQPIGQPLFPNIGGEAKSLAGAATALPAAAFTASILFDVLAIVAETPEHAQSYAMQAVELLKVGLSASLATLGLGLLDSLNVPPATPAGAAATRRLALDGAVVAVYLLDLAARQKQLARMHSVHGSVDSGAIGLSLIGITLLGASGRLK